MLYSDLQKPITIVGMGITGNAILELLLQDGIPQTDILTHDQKTHDQDHSSGIPDPQTKTLIVSPGVPLSTPWIQEFKKAGAYITSELELAHRVLTSEKIIGITGAVGKSTVTSIIGSGLQDANIPAFIGGNLGVPLARYALEVLRGQRTRASWVVLELSSYQLENFESLRCESSILVSLTPNHMERYPSLEDYYQTKLSLVPKTTGYCLFNRSGLDLAQFMAKYQGPQFIWTDHKDGAIPDGELERSQLVGRHNRDNISLAYRLGQLHHFPKEYYDGIMRFRGLPHRLENLGEYDGVLFLNDSKATTVASVLQAVESIQELIDTKARSWVLIGGKDKNLPWAQLAALKDQTKLRFVFFGEVGPKAQLLSGLNGDCFTTLAEAIAHLRPRLQSADLVLLSPGGTSWDEFKSFEERGEFFKKQIERQ